MLNKRSRPVFDSRALHIRAYSIRMIKQDIDCHVASISQVNEHDLIRDMLMSFTCSDRIVHI